MLKKIILSCTLAGTAFSASAVDLQKFQGDLDTVMQGIANDVAPTLRLGALAGDLQSDSTIDHADIALGIGLNISDGVATSLRPGATTWNFVSMDSFIPSSAPTWFETFMAYPSYKFTVGFGLGGGWDTTLSGNYMPSALTKTALSSVPGSPEVGFTNIGIAVRKAIIRDSNTTPGLSLGASYHYTSLHLGVDAGNLIPKNVDVGGGVTMNTTGSLDFDSNTQIVTVDLHVSKHFSIFEPYFKFSGAYQNTNFTGKADLKAVESNSTSENFASNASVNLSDFAFLSTVGFDLNLFLFHYNLNVLADLSRAKLGVNSFSLDGLNANAFVINTGIHWAF